MKYYPNNTLAQYTTKLLKPIELEGEWEVALVEILYPCSFHHITSQCTLSVGKRSFQIPVGQYNSVNHLLKVINETPYFKKMAHFKYDDVSCAVALKYKETGPMAGLNDGRTTLLNAGEENDDLTIKLSPELDSVLGNVSFAKLRSPTGENPIDLNYHIPDQLFIYTDIVENQYVGDTSAPLLRIVSVTEGSKNIQKIFNTPHYVMVQRRQFDTIDMDIRTRTGLPAPFHHGLVTCKLHFRRCL